MIVYHETMTHTVELEKTMLELVIDSKSVLRDAGAVVDSMMLVFRKISNGYIIVMVQDCLHLRLSLKIVCWKWARHQMRLCSTL